MPATSDWFATEFEGRPLMAVLRGFDATRSVELASAAWDLGIEAVEVPVQSASTCAALAAVVEAGRARGHHVGAGTVTTIERLRKAVEAGAAFTVAPGLDAEVASASMDAGLAHLPGVSTPSEIQAALRLGLTWVKAFPASVLGEEWFRAMRGPFPEVTFVATGGMDAGNARRFLEVGARVVAVGSALGDPEQLPALSRLLADSRAEPPLRARGTRR